MEGLGKVAVAVAGSEVEGLYGLLRGAILHPPYPQPHIPLRKLTTSCLPPQEPTGVTPEASDPVTKMVEQALEAASPASEEALPANMQPLCIQFGASKGCTDAGLKVAQRGHQPHMLQSVHMCTECTWDGVGVSLLWQIILQPGCTLVPQEKSS